MSAIPLHDTGGPDAVTQVGGNRERQVPGRPRLLSYCGRWGRSRRLLPADAQTVLDIGAASGYGTAAIYRAGPAERLLIGVERDRQHLHRAAKSYGWLPMVGGDANRLPFADSSVDGILLLDILEHLEDPDSTLQEAHRVLRPGGVLIFSVPHKGPLRFLDSLNVYPALRRRFQSLPPLNAADQVDGDGHRHFSREEIVELCGDRFSVDTFKMSGLGLQEIVHLAALIIARGILRSERLYHLLLPLHFAVYLLDDAIPAGPLSYHLTARAWALQVPQPQPSPTVAHRRITQGG